MTDSAPEGGSASHQTTGTQTAAAADGGDEAADDGHPRKLEELEPCPVKSASKDGAEVAFATLASPDGVYSIAVKVVDCITNRAFKAGLPENMIVTVRNDGAANTVVIGAAPTPTADVELSYDFEGSTCAIGEKGLVLAAGEGCDVRVNFPVDEFEAGTLMTWVVNATFAQAGGHGPAAVRGLARLKD
jgi:hypothetical protein